MGFYIKGFSLIQTDTTIKSGYMHIVNSEDGTEVVHTFEAREPIDYVSLLAQYLAGETTLHTE